MKFFYQYRGGISVFLCLMLLPMIIFGGMVTDAARIYGSESLISEAGELAMNAALSQYSTELKDDYGLLVMEKNPSTISSDLEEYFVNTIKASGLAGAEDINALIDLNCESFNAYGVEGSQIYYTEAEKQQILEYMKYRAPVCLGEDLLEKLNAINESKKQVEATEAQMEFAESMEDLQEACENANAAIKKYCDITEENPLVNASTVSNAMYSAKVCCIDAGQYFFMWSVADAYAEKGASDNSEDYFESMSYFNYYASELSYFSTEVPENEFSNYLTCLFYKKNIPSDLVIEAAIDDADEDEQESLSDTYDAYKANRSVLSSYYNALGNCAVNQINLAHSYIAEMDINLTNSIDAAQTALGKLQELHGKLEEAQGKHTNWKNKVSELSDSETKTSMQGQLGEYETLLDESDYQSLYQHLTENQQNLESMRTKLRQTTFCGIPLYENIDSTEINTIKSNVDSWGFFPYSITGAVSQIGDQNPNFIAANFSVTEISNSETLFSIKEDVFYTKLQELCTVPPETEQSKEDKETTNKLLKESSISELSIVGIANLKADWGSQQLPTEKLSQTGSNGDDNTKYTVSGEGSAESRSGRKKAIANAKSSVSAMADFLDSLSQILENCVENIYIMEYGMQMFSYYTIDKESDGNEIEGDITSISGDDLKDNALYKSEVEYMLWGNKDVQKNVNNTKLLLYGIRMVFNTIYTFSDREIVTLSKSMATAMSCGVAFLIPVFDVLIKVAIAGAETALDVEYLFQGKNVPLLKNKDNSYIRDAIGLSPENSGNSGVTMNYKEYLSVFLLINTFGALENKTLARIADCIQLNTEMDIIEGYTMVSVKATVKSRTTFLSKAAELPDSGIETTVEDWYNITYKSVLGY